MPATAHASVGMTWLLNSAAATDARQCTSKCRPAKAAETSARRHDKTAAERPKDALNDHGSPLFCPLQPPRFGPVEALH